MANLKSTDIKGDMMYIATVKTHDRLPINLNKFAKEILKKYEHCNVPDFSVRISPVLPNSRGMPCMTARGKKDTKSKPICYASFLLFLRRVTL